MLQVTKGPPLPATGEDTARDTSFADALNSVFGIVRRQLPVVLIVLAITTVLGLVYLLTTPSRYTATATMVMDTHKVQLFQQQSVLGEMAVDTGTVLTQIEVLKSQNIGLAVIKNLHLTDDPEFVSPHEGLIGALIGSVADLFGGGNADSETQLQRRALTNFDKDRAVSRVGLTYVMDIHFTSYSPAKAATIANAIADAYITDQLESKYQATRRASIWLQSRIKELRAQAFTAQRAVVDFKQSHNIVDTGGQLMDEQELAELNSQLTLAQAAVAEAKARLDNINQVMTEAIPDGAVADALKSQVIIALRNKYLDLAAREALWAQKYGQNHLAVVNLRDQMLELRKSISDEMKKIAEAFQSNYNVAVAREDAIKARLDKTVSQSQVTDQAKVQLRELESNAQSYQAMYDSFLQRYMEAVQQESFPITEARLISPALPPINRSSPKAVIVLGITAMAGMVLSFGAAFLREMSDNVFRTGTQIETHLQAHCLAVMPAISAAGAAGEPEDESLGATMAALFRPKGLSTTLPRAAGIKAFRPHPAKSMSPIPPLPPHEALGGGPIPQSRTPELREISPTSDLLRYAVNAPFSQFTEALRSVKVAIDLNGAVQTNKVIGITSAIPNEGKSTISVNLASLVAHSGARVILIDSDLRNPSTSRNLAPNAQQGFVDVLTGQIDVAAALWKDKELKLDFLPVGNASKLIHAHDLLGSERTKAFIARLRDVYDYVILDLAPLTPVVDTRATSTFVDSYIYIIEWGRTKVDVVEHSLSVAPEIYDRLLGVILNKADMTALRRYEHYRSNYYYKKYYSKYGYTA